MAQDRRLKFQTILETILGTRNVYFQPPANLVMKYPCIVYERDRADTKFADNNPYKHTSRYQVIYLDKNPDGVVYDKLAALPMSLFQRAYQADNLNHDVFNIYF